LSFLAGLLDDDDLWRLKMGRFSDADEKMMQRLVEGRGGGKLWRELFGAGVDVGRVGYVSSRPRMGSRGVTFGFSHRWVSKEVRRDVPHDRVYFVAGKAEAREAGGRWDRRVAWGGTQRGAYWVKRGSPLPAGAVYAAGVHVATGHPPGTASSFQGYMEREGAAVYCLATNGETVEQRTAFWNAVEGWERHGGRVQARIISELPYEDGVGLDGRVEAVERFCEFFRLHGLPFAAVIHAPEEQNDERNWHMHLAYHDRPLAGWREGRPLFAPGKSAVVRSIGLVGQLRDRWAECVNAVLAARGIERRYDPRSYAEAGVEKEPTPHLGSSAMGRERKGIATGAGSQATGAVLVERAAAAQRQLKGMAEADAARVAGPLAMVRAAAGGDGHVRAAAAVVAAAAADFVEAGAGLRVAVGRRLLASWSARDLPRRLGLARKQGGRIGEVAALLEGDCRRETAEVLKLRVLGERRARNVAARSGRLLREAEQELSAELVVAELRRARHGLDLAVDAARREGRMLPAEWQARGRRAEAEQRRRRLVRAEAETAASAAAEAVFGPDGAARLMAELADRGRRAAVLASLDREARQRPHLADLAGLARRFGLADRAVAAADAVVSRRARTERDGAAYGRLVRSEAEQIRLESSLSAASTALQAAERAVGADRRASALALARGLVVTRPERDGRERE
jgi:hypothetical protein